MGNGEESVHASIARDALYKEKNGILAISQLIEHFELTNVGGKTYELNAEFHSASLEAEQDPDTLNYKLVELQSVAYHPLIRGSVSPLPRVMDAQSLHQVSVFLGRMSAFG